MKKTINTIVLFSVILLIPSGLFSREFLNTVLHLNFGGMYSFTNKGDILDAEESAANEAFSHSNHNSHYETAYVITLDVVPMDPIILGMESHAVKIGVRGTVGFHFMEQKVATTSDYSDQLMDYQSYMIGPVIHYAPFIDPSDIDNEYTASSGFTAYALYGPVNGNLTAFPAIRKSSIATVSDHESKFNGGKFNIGIGAEVALCSLNFGMNLYYSYTRFRLNERIYTTTGKDMYLKEGCLEIYVGLPIEFILKPFIPSF